MFIKNITRTILTLEANILNIRPVGGGELLDTSPAP